MTELTQAAWHPDPLGRFTHRYWNGSSWTEHVANDGHQSIDPLGATVAPKLVVVQEQVSGQTMPPYQPEEAATLGSFAIVDVETTGLSALQHRVLEIAVVRTDSSGRITGEWTSRINPEGPVGATHVHGITASDVASAPKFRELIPELNAWMAGAVVVAHNAQFDLSFLRAEYGYAGWDLPEFPSFCTMSASHHYLPAIDRYRLADCCAAAKVPMHDAHSALGDARATAGLLGHYLDPVAGQEPRAADFATLRDALGVVWPTGPSREPYAPAVSSATHAQLQIAKRMSAQKAPTTQLVKLLEGFSLIDALDEGAPEGTLAYLEKLAEVLEDGEITHDEFLALSEVAESHGLSDEDRRIANSAIVLALCHLALDDGVVSRDERTELRNMSRLLSVPDKLLTSTLERAESARHARLSAGLKVLPDDWPHGEPLRVGAKVVFTGCDPELRDRLEKRAEELGVRIIGKISRKITLLVTDGGFSGTKAAAAQEAGTRVVHPELFEILLNHLQPAVADR